MRHNFPLWSVVLVGLVLLIGLSIVYNQTQILKSYQETVDTNSKGQVTLDLAHKSRPHGPRDTKKPSVNITNPENNDVVSGSVTITAEAYDNVGVTSVQFFVGGTLIGDDISAPYSTSWDTTAYVDGQHTLTAVARDAAGNSQTSLPVVVTVSNGAPPAAQCADGIDNDGDGKIDYGTASTNDPGCTSATDNTETGTAICDNGVDETNDADTLADYRLSGGDPGCASVTDTSEISGQCDDKLDNDADTFTDYPSDLGCTAYTDNNETNAPTPTYDEKGCLNNYVEIKPGFGCFVYHDNGDNANRPVRVWYYLPSSGFPGTNSKIVFSMHGSERNAEAARDYLSSYTDRYNTLLLAPEFSKTYYPDADDYNRGFVKGGGGTGALRNRNDWTFLTIEEIFDVVRAQFTNAPTKYSIGGNSAAGQFISRFAWLVPEARYDVASGSNGGWYTLPIGTSIKTQESYCPAPCVYRNGVSDLISNKLITEANISASYSKNFVLPIGELDINDDYDLEHNTFTDAQGLNRYERALWYNNYMKADAQARGVPYKWNLIVVQDTPHAVAEMTHKTALAIFENVYKDPHTSLSPMDDTYIEAANKASNFGSSSNVYMDGGSTAAQIAYMKFDLSSIQSGNFDVAALKVWIHDDSPDTYSLKAVSSNSWNEENLTWNNAPSRMQEIGSTKGAYGDGYLYIVITDYAKTRAGNQLSLAIDGGSGTTGDMGFYSKEASDKRPVLELFAK